jgi:hypothetical protein
MHRKDLLKKGYTSRTTGCKSKVLEYLGRNKSKYKSYRVVPVTYGKWELYAK